MYRVGSVVVTTTASGLALWTGICIRYMASGKSPQGDGYASQRTSETLLLTPQTYFGSTELLLVLLNAYALSTATLHQCRIKDKYQNHVAGLCLLGAEAVSYGLLPGYTGQEESTGPLALLPLALLFGLLASALAHAAIGPRDEETEVGLKGDTWRNTEEDIEGTHEGETQAESASKA